MEAWGAFDEIYKHSSESLSTNFRAFRYKLLITNICLDRNSDVKCIIYKK